MLKKDWIFWCATGIFVLAVVLFAATQEQLWLALMIASYLLRPTLAWLGVARRSVDERQDRAFNIAPAILRLPR